MRKRLIIKCCNFGCKSFLNKYENEPINIKKYGWEYIPDKYTYGLAINLSF